MAREADLSYFRTRAWEERNAAARSSCMIKDLHLEMAELYEGLGRFERRASRADGDARPA